MPSISSMWRSMSLSFGCPVPPWWEAIACISYVVQYAWYLSLIFPTTVLSGECIYSLLLLWWRDMCRAIYVNNMVEWLTRQGWQLGIWCIVHPSSWVILFVCEKTLLDTSRPGWVSTDPFHSGYTLWYCSTARSVVMAPVLRYEMAGCQLKFFLY